MFVSRVSPNNSRELYEDPEIPRRCHEKSNSKGGTQELRIHDVGAESQDVNRFPGIISGPLVGKVENIALVVQVICLVTIREYGSC